MTEVERKRRIWVLIRALRIIWAGLSISQDIHEFMAAIEIYAHASSKIILENFEPLEAAVSKAHRIVKDYDHAMLGKAAIDYFKPRPTPEAPAPERKLGAGIIRGIKA